MRRMRKLFLLSLVLTVFFVSAAAESAPDPLSSDPAAIRFVSVPEAAFSTENARVIAATADGVSVLIMNGYELYIWNIPEGKRVPVTFIRDGDIEWLNACVENSMVLQQRGFGGRATEEQLAQRKEAAEKSKQSYLQSRGLTRFVNLDQVAECYPRLVELGAECTSVGLHYAAVNLNYLGIGNMVIDLRTGETVAQNSNDSSMIIASSLWEDRLLMIPVSEEESDTVVDLATGEARMLLTDYTPVEDNLGYTWSLKSQAVLAPDDSILTIASRYDKADDKLVVHWALAAIGRDRSRVIPLDTLENSSGKRLLLTGDGKYAMACETVTGGAAVVNLETDEVRIPPAEDVLYLGSCGTGFIGISRKTMFPFLLRADTLESVPLRLAGPIPAGLTYAALTRVTGNSRDLLFPAGDIVQGYSQLEWE